MSRLTNDGVRIEVKRKPPEVVVCITAMAGTGPEFRFEGEGDTYLSYANGTRNAYPGGLGRVGVGQRVSLLARICNRDATGRFELVMRNETDNLPLFYGAQSDVGAGECVEPFKYGDVVFLMPDHTIEVKLYVGYMSANGKLCKQDELAFRLEVARETVEVLDTARNDAGKWVVGAQLFLDPTIECANANDGTYYFCNYQIVMKPKAGNGWKESLVKTETGKSKLHALVSNCELEGEGVLNWEQAGGTELELELWRYDMRTEEDTIVEVQTITLQSGENKFRVKTPRDEVIYWFEVLWIPILNIYLAGPLSGGFFDCTDPPCEFILSESDPRAEVGHFYTFYSAKSVAPTVQILQVVPKENVYEFRGTQTIDVPIITDIVSETWCGFIGIDPASDECALELAQFTDAGYLADFISRVVDHKDLAGNTAAPDILDVIFVPLALATGVAPAGGAGKKFFGHILKKGREMLTRELNAVGLWIEKNMDLIAASIMRGYKSDVDLAVKRIAEAADQVPGSEGQLRLLEEAKNIMEESIKGTDYRTAVSRTEAWGNEIFKRLEVAGSKTPPKEVIEKTGVKNAVKHIPGVVSMDPKDVSGLEKVIRGNRLYVKHEGVWLRLEEVLIRDGKVTQKFRPHAKGLFGAIRAHPVTTSAVVGIAMMASWYTLDNVQFIVYLLRSAKVLNDLWGDQWDEYSRNCKDVHFLLKDNPCDHVYQEDYLLSLSRLRALIESTEPIPTDKIGQAKYLFNVLYGRDIGDPNEYLLESCETKFSTWNHLYYELTLGCTSPLEPEWGFETIEFEKARFQVKVEKVLDGDTIRVSCTDEAWPVDAVHDVRVLGVDTPDPVRDGYNNILGYQVRRKEIPEKDYPEDPTTPVLKKEFTSATTFTNSVLSKQTVWLEIDPHNAFGKHDRVLATIEVDHPDYTGDLGAELLRRGHAMVFFYTPNGLMNEETRTEYKIVEGLAQEAKLGVWSGEAEELPTGKIRCASTPNGAYIYFDDKTTPEGMADTTIDNVTIGARIVDLRGLTYRNVYCEDCRCGYRVVVTEGEKETVECTMSAIYEIKTPYWEDEEGERWPKADVAKVYVDDGSLKTYTGLKAPCTLEFGKDYTGLNKFTIKKIGSGADEREVDHGEWRISIELDDYKTIAETVTMGPGIFKSVIPILSKGPSGEEIPPEPTPPPGPPSGEGTLHIGHAFDIDTGEQISTGANKFPLYVLISGTKCGCRCYIPETLGFGDDAFCNRKDNLCPLPLGEHTFVVERVGYEDFSFTKTINDGDVIDAPKIEMKKATVSGKSYFDPERNPSGLFIEHPDTFIASVTNTGGTTTSYNIRYNFRGMSEGIIGELFTFTSDIWSDPVAPNETIDLATLIDIPVGAIPMHVETARYEIDIELQGAAVL